MKIELKKIAIRELAKGYKDADEEGVIGYNGLLNIRPKYQREFVYNEKQRNAVISSVRRDLPLNVMYWAVVPEGLEILDGQQRTISICSYVAGKYAVDFQQFHNLTEEEQKQILDYELIVYICDGTERERLDWFETINVAGEKLTKQELLNAVYSGSWLNDAKRHFSKSNCGAYNLAKDYVSGSPIRQDYLETALEWVSNGDIRSYMSANQHKPNANALWLHFQEVINWVKATFPNYRKEMKGLDWGTLYTNYGKDELDSKTLEAEIKKLMEDEDVTKKAGIYPYLLSGDAKTLSIRAFSNNQKREAYERQNGICPACAAKFELAEMEGDHITPWVLGGKTISSNCQMLCRGCNRSKGAK